MARGDVTHRVICLLNLDNCRDGMKVQQIQCRWYFSLGRQCVPHFPSHDCSVTPSGDPLGMSEYMGSTEALGGPCGKRRTASSTLSLPGERSEALAGKTSTHRANLQVHSWGQNTVLNYTQLTEHAVARGKGKRKDDHHSFKETG